MMEARDGEIVRVPWEKLDIDPDTRPPQDDTFSSLLRDAMSLRIPLDFAVVPVRYIRPFAAAYKPESWHYWRPLVERFKTQIRANDFPPMLTYQVGDFFVMSDDYQAYYAYLECNSECAPCHVMGGATGEHLPHIQRLTEEQQKLKLGIP